MSIAIEAPDELELANRDLDFPLVQLPDHYEVINGQIVETPILSTYAVRVADRLNWCVLPGFRAAVAEMFPPVESLPPAGSPPASS